MTTYNVYFRGEFVGSFDRSEEGRYLFNNDPKGIIGHVFSGINPDRTFAQMQRSPYYSMVDASKDPNNKTEE